METMTKREEEKVETFKAIEKPKLPLKEKIAYGFGDLGNGMMFDLGQIYLLKFYTDVLGISATYAGLVFLISKIFDAFVDTGVGSYVDSRKNIGPRGKFRPYILFGTVPLAIMTVMTFITPNLDYTGKVIWAFATYMIFSMAYSIVNIPYGSLSASMTVNADDRTQLSVFRNMGSQGALFITGIIVLPMVSQFPNQAIGFPVVVGVLAAIGVIFHIICYKGVKERFTVEPPDTKGQSRIAFKNLLKNGAFAVLAFYTLLTITAMFLKQSTQLYYFQYVLGEVNLVGIVSLFNFIALIPALYLTTVLSKKFGKKMTAIIGVVGFIICEMLNYAFFGENVVTFLIFSTLGMFFLVIPNTVTWAFIADVVEYGQWKSGVRTEGIIYSSYSFTRKVSQALAGFIPGIALTFIGYQPNVEQTADTLQGLGLLYFVVPAVISLIAVIVFGIFYKLTDKRHEQIVKELALREEI
ncbi:glycoside-pentoside-hexuronide (GPH):cation symporter [Staphylococcus simulans]|uniref:glycoside-pentoside-hexuronide (GPH):cation symporter n=1 Tax=Staphylococcus simulans TaxID=1286 RepID=UPI000D1FC26C|nr:glycoside-pentoside-hexuronide (GPH):cation symporter [Staphylococcus simulans]PTI86137.1 MFS transporter [Staphylococcus simulans]RIN53339.1 MFS transporter [Staphylococcus simulans]UXR30713.1 glycoside-pentoside-hexuronide (GPH):cation symporter [Staphylococcus simulans]UXR52914.1 glycoside-pentoside-hexuronide (GPH):cation symporter [Staphylococcus simulans]